MYQILIVSHKNHKNYVVVGNMLKKAGYNIRYSNSGEEAISLINDNANKIDLLVSDILLQDMSGFDLAKTIRNIDENLPILFASYQFNPQLIEQVYDSGGSDFILLPCLKCELKNRINNLLKIKIYQENIEDLEYKLDANFHILQTNTHDAKNPLSSIFSLSGMPATVFSSTEEMQQMLDIVHDASKIVINLINEALDYFRLSNDDMEFDMLEVDLLSVLNQVVEINNPLAKVKKQQIHFNYEADNYVILADNLKVFRALNNIVGNAIKFSPLGKNVWINIVKKDNKIIVQIKDEGPGFKKDELGDVFQKNKKFSARPTGGESSTGLGLVIVKFILEKHNASISLESEEGKGSLFTIKFDDYN